MADKKLKVTADQINNSVINSGSIDLTFKYNKLQNSDIVLEKNQEVEYDLSEWLPDDGCPYLVEVRARGTNRIDGNFNIQLFSEASNNVGMWILFGDTVYGTTIRGQMSNSMWMLIGADRKLRVKNVGSTTTINRIFLTFYIKVKNN